jgi:hypothetical protein
VSPKSASYSFEKGSRPTEKTVLYICRCPRVKKKKAPLSSQYLPDSSFPTPKLSFMPFATISNPTTLSEYLLRSLRQICGGASD